MHQKTYYVLVVDNVVVYPKSILLTQHIWVVTRRGCEGGDIVDVGDHSV